MRLISFQAWTQAVKPLDSLELLTHLIYQGPVFEII